MKNKLFTFLLMLFVVALMTGCGKGSNPNETTSNNAMEKPSNSYGASAYSFTIGTSYGVYGGYDYYWCLD